MAIVFHCEHCTKKVSAPDQAGGKMGKCPHCGQRIFIPHPSEQIEEIPLAPEDPQDSQRRKAMLQEQIRLQEELVQHTEAPEDSKSDGKATAEPAPGDDDLPFAFTNEAAYAVASSKPAGGEGLEGVISQFIFLMAKGDLESADRLASQIAAKGPSALKKVEEMAMQDFLHPQTANVPPSVISGFFKKLLSKFQK